jgi:hypothetical protein
MACVVKATQRGLCRDQDKCNIAGTCKSRSFVEMTRLRLYPDTNQ